MSKGEDERKEKLVWLVSSSPGSSASASGGESGGGVRERDESGMGWSRRGEDRKEKSWDSVSRSSLLPVKLRSLWSGVVVSNGVCRRAGVPS